MNPTIPVTPSAQPDFRQWEPIKYLMQHRDPEALHQLADKIDDAMLWLVFNHEFVSNQEREFADLYAELRDARNFFPILGRHLQSPRQE
jgi:hypothetical protein